MPYTGATRRVRYWYSCGCATEILEYLFTTWVYPRGAPQPHTPPLRELKVPCSYQVRAIGKFALLRYLSEFRFQVLTAITNDLS